MYSYHLEYLGEATVDKRLSTPMIPWIVAQIRRGKEPKKVIVRIEKGVLEVRREDTNTLIDSHPLNLVSRLTVHPKNLFYTIKAKEEPLLYCYLYETDDQHIIFDIMATMKEQSNKFNSRTTTTLCPDISPSSSHFFEVLYIGRIKVSQKKVPETFIDDALEKFKAAEKLKKEKDLEQNPVVDSEEAQLVQSGTPKNGSYGSTEVLKSDTVCDTPPIEMMRRRSGSLGSILVKKPEGFCKENSAVIQPEKNRTMVFHVGRTDLRLISPDRKQVLLHKYLKDITCAQQGVRNPSHLAFICKENVTEPPSFIGYVFNCQSPPVAEDLVAAISQASVCDKRTAVISCEHCPMVWYHKLCSDLEGLSDRAMEEALSRRLESLPPDELAIVQTKLAGAELPQGGTKEHIQLVMMLLRAHCESKQSRHVHDTPENRHEFLTQYLGGGTIFMKAKRSLTSSFDQLLKRKASRDDFGSSLSLPPNATLRDIVHESKNNSPNDTPDGSIAEEPTPGSMMDIFIKLGNSPKTPQQDKFSDNDSKQHPRSWRQAIFNTVVTPSKSAKESSEEPKKDKQFYRDLWKKAINQQVLLIRMEKENAKLSERMEEANVKRIKLEYDEIGTVESSEVWDLVIKENKKMEYSILMNAMKKGVPKAKRGEVWLHLTKQYSSKLAPFTDPNFPNYHVPYEQLLKQLTSHQHAILIDLGRTFPSHTYFSSPLGPGQLALFNLLKAYSLLDPEVGYCQGLSFIAAVLLLHMSEEEAFFVLKQLMFRRGLRHRYLPDMSALQVSLYQLSRLLHDRHPDLYSHFDSLDVAPTLYAAPWLLTLFSSQFPLGFVARVFDLMFADTPNVLFKIALVLIGLHKEELLDCDSFEMVMDYMKNHLPQIDSPTMDRILKEVVTMDVGKELSEYGVEYHVLQEEMSTPRPETKRIKELEAANLAMSQQVKDLTHQLQIASNNTARLESSRAFNMSQLNKLETQVKTLEVTVATLGQFISDLGYTNKDIQIPGDVLRILTQINISQKRQMIVQRSAPELPLAEIQKAHKEVNKQIGRVITEEERESMLARREAREKAKVVPPPKPEAPKLTSSQSTYELGSHPLDLNGVDTHFEGTTNLKKIQLQRTKTTSDAKNIELKIIEPPRDSVTEKLKLTKNKVTRLFESCNDVFKHSDHDKPFAQETQLLIKSQAMTNNHNGFS